MQTRIEFYGFYDSMQQALRPFWSIRISDQCLIMLVILGINQHFPVCLIWIFCLVLFWHLLKPAYLFDECSTPMLVVWSVLRSLLPVRHQCWGGLPFRSNWQSDAFHDLSSGSIAAAIKTERNTVCPIHKATFHSPADLKIIIKAFNLKGVMLLRGPNLQACPVINHLDWFVRLIKTFAAKRISSCWSAETRCGWCECDLKFKMSRFQKDFFKNFDVLKDHAGCWSRSRPIWRFPSVWLILKWFWI